MDGKIFITESCSLPRSRFKHFFLRYDEDGFFPTTPGCKRAVHEAVKILKDLGHEVIFDFLFYLISESNAHCCQFQVVPFELPHLKYFLYTYFDFMLSDNGETTLDYIGEDEILDQVRHLLNTKSSVSLQR